MGVGDRAWMQTDPELVAPCALQSLKKMKHLFSILNYPWFFVTISLDVQSEHWVGPLQTVQFVCWEGSPKWIFWCARILCCVYPLFSKDMKLQSFCLSTIESVYLTVLFWMLGLQTLLLYIPEHLCANSLLFCIFFTSGHTFQKAAKPDINASVCYIFLA